MAEDLGRSVLRLETDPTGLRRGMAVGKAEAQELTRSLQASLTAAGRAMTNTGQQLTLGVTLPVLAAGKAIVSTGLDFDTTLRQIVGLAGVSEDAIAGIKDRILELGGEVGKTPQELAEAFYFVASAGFEAEEAMSVLETAAQASAAGLGRVQDVAKVLGLTINAYGHENITAAHAADVLVAAVREGTAEADAFAGVLGRVVPTAAQMGVSFDQVVASLAAMTITGLSAEESATSLNQVLVSLLDPTAEAALQMEAIGLSAQGLREQLREEGLLATLRTLEERFAGNEEASSKVFGNVRALRGVLSLLGLDAQQLTDIFAETKNATGDLALAFSDTEGPARDMARAQAEIDEALIELSEDVLPVAVDLLKQVAGIIGTVADVFKSLPPGVRTTIVQVLALVAAIGPLLYIGGSLVTAFGALLGGVTLFSNALTAKLVPGLLLTRGAVAAALIPIAALVTGFLDAHNAALEFWDAVSQGDKEGQLAALEKELGSLPIWEFASARRFELENRIKALRAELDQEAAAAERSSLAQEQLAKDTAFVESTMSLLGPVLKAVGTEYLRLAGTTGDWANMTQADMQKALEAQREYTSGVLADQRRFRTEIEEAYKAASDAALDYQRTEVALRQKQQELKALDREYVAHKGTMTKLEVAEYKLRRTEIIYELNALKLHAALIGNDMEKTTKITSLLTSKEMKDGLTSKFPETRAAYEALEADLLAKLHTIERKGGPASKAAALAIAAYLNPHNKVSPLDLITVARWGTAIGNAFMEAVVAQLAANAIRAALGVIAELMESTSPPKSPSNPLHHIDRWGRATGEAYVGPMIEALDSAAARARRPLDALRAALAFGNASPALASATAGLDLGASSTGSTFSRGGDRHYHLTVQGNLIAKDEPSALKTLQRMESLSGEDD